MTDAEVKQDPGQNQDLPSLKSKLEELRKNKEEWFKKKEDLKLGIASLINQIKGLKSKSDSSSKSISELKSERNRCNDVVRDLIKKFKDLSKEKEEKLSKLKFKVDPEAISAQIDRLERRIETEAPSFEKEKELMKSIKSLRKQKDEAKGVSAVLDSMRKLSKQIDEAKAKAEDFHGQLTGKLKESKGGYGEFIALSKRINGLKGMQEKAFENFVRFKKEFSELNARVSEKSKEMDAERRVKVKEFKRVRSVKKHEEEKILKKRVEAVEEKLKKKRVLTTEDILAFQGMEEKPKDI